MGKELDKKIEAKLYSMDKPSKKQEEEILKFLSHKYGDVSYTWVEDKEFPGGFRLEVGTEVYDWSLDGRFEQFKEAINHAKGEDIIPLLKKTIVGFAPKVFAKEIGVVKTVGDGIAIVTGLDTATFGEILLFKNDVKGMVQEIAEDHVGCILFDSGDEVSAGSTVTRTGKTAGIPVGENFLGRVIDALGNPIDDLGDIRAYDYFPIEKKAPGIIERQPVNVPLKTGILAIDSMFPIGRGQRELIIGDRQTGKTAIALDTIINQKGKDVTCIYVAIGQKNSSVVQIKENLKKHGALDYTVIVSASASESSSLQYIAPYSGCAMAEYFMSRGKDVLIVYDDLSKHAVAYRALSLLLDRSPGREAYPGDVFYLHSRLLERACRRNDNFGGGSITALPIVETQAGDVSAYIPTNIISITDGQIFLESNLFFSGQRPAVNVGLSVSRVGGDAQTKAMKKSASTLKLDLAQFREMEVFTQFSADLDNKTREDLKYGQRLMKLLIQSQNSPLSESEMVVLLVSALSHTLDIVHLDNILEVKVMLLDFYKVNHYELLKEIEKTKVLSDELKEKIIEISKGFVDSLDGELKRA